MSFINFTKRKIQLKTTLGSRASFFDFMPSVAGAIEGFQTGFQLCAEPATAGLQEFFENILNRGTSAPVGDPRPFAPRDQISLTAKPDL